MLFLDHFLSQCQFRRININHPYVHPVRGKCPTRTLPNPTTRSRHYGSIPRLHQFGESNDITIYFISNTISTIRISSSIRHGSLVLVE